MKITPKSFDREVFEYAHTYAPKHFKLPDKNMMYSFDAAPFLIEPTYAASNLKDHYGVVLSSPAQIGKGLSENTPVPTPNGFTLMRDLTVGDIIYSMDGSLTKVTYKTDPLYKPMFRLFFDDGTTLDADNDHRWLASKFDSDQHRTPEQVYTTQEMVDYIEKKRRCRSMFSIRMPKPVCGVERELPVDPYILGVWLGKGLQGSGDITGQKSDLKDMFPGIPVHHCKQREYWVTVLGLDSKLSELGILDNKRIPAQYLTASIDQRLALVQGLMDTDGTCSSKGQCSITQARRDLLDDIETLLNSLGIKTHRREIEKRIKSSHFTGIYPEISFRTHLPVFRLERKKQRLKNPTRNDTHWRYIRRIEPIPTVPSYCIMVDHPSHTYLAGKQYCVTHNTSFMLNLIGWMCRFDPSNSLILMDSFKSVQKLSKAKLRPFLRDQVGLRAMMRYKTILDDHSKQDKYSATDHYTLSPTASLMLGSSKSASDLCSSSVKYLFLDELDRFATEVEGEGDPVTLAMARQLRFKGMVVMTSTPTVQQGRITQNFLQGTQEYWCAFCDRCGHPMHVDFKDINFDGSTPTYACLKCKHVFTEQQIIQLDHGYHQENDTPKTDTHGRILRSFKVTSPLIHAVYNWSFLKQSEVDSRKISEAHYRSFINTGIGEVYTPTSRVDLNIDLLNQSRRYFTPNMIPAFVQYITVGVDVQDKRFEYIVMGYNETGSRVAVLKYGIVHGRPDVLLSQDPDAWKALLTELSNLKYRTKAHFNQEPRDVYPALICIDSGHFTNHVYEWVINANGINRSNRFRAVKGSSKMFTEFTGTFIDRVTSINVQYLGSKHISTDRVSINTNEAKDFIHRQLLNLQTKSHGLDWWICSHPDANLDIQYFEQMNAEYREVDSRGRIQWRKKGHKQNEALDCTVYSLAGFELLRMNLGTQTIWNNPVSREDMFESKDDEDDEDDQTDEPYEAI